MGQFPQRQFTAKSFLLVY